MIAVLLGTTVFLVGCPDGNFIKDHLPNNCGGQGWTLTTVYYGDSRVLVIPLSEVEAGQEFRFALVTERKGRGAASYANAEIKIKGKRSPEDDWFTEISGTKSDVTIHTCVDNGLAVGDEVHYTVEVWLPGETTARAILDPRAIVIN